MRLDRTLFTSTQYPADYGYIDDKVIAVPATDPRLEHLSSGGEGSEPTAL